MPHAKFIFRNGLHLGLLFTRWTRVQTFFRKHFAHIVYMQAINHAGVVIGGLDDRDVPIAVVIAGSRAVQDTEGYDFPALQLDDFVTVLGFTSIAIVHTDSFVSADFNVELPKF
jgi:hypothetical protein